MRSPWPVLLFCLACLAAIMPARADIGAGAAGAAALPPPWPGLECRRAIAAAGQAAGIPPHLMSAIGRVESGRRTSDGAVHPWPWSINAEGVDHIYDTREAALAGVRALQAQGVRSIDIGCMQVNLLHHPNAFASLEQAFDPVANAHYAARFLTQLHDQTGSWERATAQYHSATPELGDPYQRRVAAVLAEESVADQRFAGLLPPGPLRPPGTSAAGTGALMLGNRSENARIIPLAGVGQGRGLDSYRAAPVRVAARSG